MDDQLTLLRREFNAENGSFLLALRADLKWDKAAFTRLEMAMRRACERFHNDDQLDRWIAEGFHYMATFVRDWTSHPNFPRPEPEQYYIACMQRIDDLANWYFNGFHGYQEPHEWSSI